MTGTRITDSRRHVPCCGDCGGEYVRLTPVDVGDAAECEVCGAVTACCAELVAAVRAGRTARVVVWALSAPAGRD